MQRKGLLCIGIITLLAVSTATLAHADNGGYEVRPWTPEEKAERAAERLNSSYEPTEFPTKSIFELSRPAQMLYLSSIITPLIVAIVMVPFVFLKLKKKNAEWKRESIFGYISDNPGCTVTDISKQEAINVGVVRYHVHWLIDARRIVQVKFMKFVRLFRNSGVYNDREITVISALRIKTCRAIILLLRDEPGLPNKQIAEKLGINESQAHTYLADLLRDDIIRYEKNGQQKMYYLESDVESILVKVGSVTADQSIDSTTV